MVKPNRNPLKVVGGESDDLIREIGDHADHETLDALLYDKVRKIVFSALYELCKLGLSPTIILRYTRSRMFRILKEFLKGHYGVR